MIVSVVDVIWIAGGVKLIQPDTPKPNKGDLLGQNTSDS